MLPKEDNEKLEYVEVEEQFEGTVDENPEKIVSASQKRRDVSVVETIKDASVAVQKSQEPPVLEPENDNDKEMPSLICYTKARKKILPVSPVVEEITVKGAAAPCGRRLDTISEATESETDSVDRQPVVAEKSIVAENKVIVPSKLTAKQLQRIVPSVDNVCHVVVDNLREKKSDDIFAPSKRQEFITEQLIEQYCQAVDDPLPAAENKEKISAHNYLALAFRLGLEKANCVKNLQHIQNACQDIWQIFPRLLRSTEVVLDCILLTTPEFSEDRFPLFQFACTQLRIWVKIVRKGLTNKKLTCITLEECVSCLYELVVYIYDREKFIAQQFAFLVRNVIVVLSDFATNMNVRSHYAPVDYISIADRVLVMAMPNGKIRKDTDTSMLPKLENLRVKHLIGAGGFGSVYKAFYSPVFNKNARPVPCTVKLVAASAFSRLEHAVTTRIVASAVCHPCIVQYLCVYSLEKATIEIMEYIKGLDLQKVVDLTHGLALPEAVVISAQLIAAITHLHLHGVIHRDIKASNALVTRRGRLKLIDFDTSKFCLAHFPNRVVTEYFRRTANEFKDGDKAGTLSYMSPEVLCADPYGRLVDLWAFGITLHKIVVGQTPFRAKTDDKLKKQVCAAKLRLSNERIHDKDEQHDSLRQFAVNIIQRLLEKDCRNRLGALSYSEVFGHPFYEKIKWEDLCKKSTLLPLGRYTDAFLKAEVAELAVQTPVDVVGFSPIASVQSLERKDLLKLESYHGKPVCESPILIFISALYKRIAVGSYHDMTKDLPPLRRVGFRFKSITETMPKRIVYTQDILIGDPGTELSNFGSIGVTCEEVQSESGHKYSLVTNIEPGSLAEVTSSLIVGDVISHVNGKNVVKAKKSTWNRYTMVTITVISSSPFRVLASFADPRKFFTLPPIVHRVRTKKQFWFKKQKDLVARQVRFFLNSSRRWMNLFLLWTGHDRSKTLFHGDILLEINGISLKGLSEQQVNILLSSKSEISVKFLPTSCLRDSKNYFDRFLHFREQSKTLADAEETRPVELPKMLSFVLPITTAAEPKSDEPRKMT